MYTNKITKIIVKARNNNTIVDATRTRAPLHADRNAEHQSFIHVRITSYKTRYVVLPVMCSNRVSCLYGGHAKLFVDKRVRIRRRRRPRPRPSVVIIITYYFPLTGRSKRPKLQSSCTPFTRDLLIVMVFSFFPTDVAEGPRP